MADLGASVRMELGGPGSGFVDVTDRVRHGEGGAGRKPGRFDPRVGTASFLIDDDDNFFRPGSPTSTYHPEVAVGGQVEAEVSYRGTAYRLFTGFIDPVEGHPSRETSNVRVGCSDLLGKLSSQPALLGPRPGERTGARVQAIMEAGGYGPTLPDGRTNPLFRLWRADGGSQFCPPTGHDTEDTVLGHLVRSARTEAGSLSLRNGRGPAGVLWFGAFRPYLRDPAPRLTLTDNPTGASDVTLSEEPQIVAADQSLLVTAVRSILPAAPGETARTVETIWPERIAQHGRRDLNNPVWLDAADAERLALRWLGLFGRPLLRPRNITVRADSQQMEPGGVHAALGARIDDRADLIYQSGASGGALNEQFDITGIDWRLSPLDARGSALELSYDLLPIQDVERWVLGISELGAHTVGRTMRRTVPWPGQPTGGDQVRPRVWASEGAGRNVYGADYDRLLRRRVLARYADPAAMQAAEGPSGTTVPLQGQLAITTDQNRHRLWAYDIALGGWNVVAVA